MYKETDPVRLRICTEPGYQILLHVQDLDKLNLLRDIPDIANKKKKTWGSVEIPSMKP
jgi:hypothetical protein